MSTVAAPKPKTVKPKATGPKKPTTQSLIKEAIVALKVPPNSSLLACTTPPSRPAIEASKTPKV